MDRDALVVKHPRSATNVPTAVDVETSGAIEDPDARQAWREANRTLSERVTQTEKRLDVVATDTAETKGMVKILLTIGEESAKERDRRSERDRLALVAREQRQRADRRTKIVVTIIVALGALAGTIVKVVLS